MSSFRLLINIFFILCYANSVLSQDCLPPSNLSIISLTDTSVNVQWQEPESSQEINSYRIAIRLVGQNWQGWQDQNILNTTFSYAFDTLQAFTSYDLRLKSECGGTPSIDSEEISFSTSSGACIDSSACNYVSLAEYNDNSCVFAYVDSCQACENGQVVTNDADLDGICDEDEIPGCTNPLACNYDVSATDDDSSCVIPDTNLCEECENGQLVTYDLDLDGVCDEDEIPGCTNPLACNYDVYASDDDSSCVIPDTNLCEECENGQIVDNDLNNDGICDIEGCTDPLACNYDSTANYDNNNCISDSIFEAVECDIYVWNSVIYNQTGTYYFPSEEACPREVLHLTIMNYDTYTDTVLECDSYQWNGTIYSESGDYSTTFTSSNGCDSLVNLHLTIANETLSLDVDTCNSYLWNDSTYIVSGEYTESFINSDNCDSIVTLNLSLFYSSFDTIQIYSCDAYEWNNQLYDSSGVYDYDYINTDGCHSVLTLDLVISDSTIVFEDITSCGDFQWNDSIYSESGSYLFESQTLSGCDSLVYLNLTVLEYPLLQIDSTSCSSFSWYDQLITETGSFIDTLINPNGCDTIIMLQATILDNLSSTTSVVSCNSYFWNGVEYDSDGLYEYNTISVFGCDSTAVLDLDICELSALNISGGNMVEAESSTSYSVPSNSQSSYSWTVSSLGTIVSGQQSSQITVDWSSNFGSSTICVTETLDCDGQPCEGQEYCIEVTVQQTSLVTEFNRKEVLIYPNPMRSQSMVHFYNPNEETVDVHLFDVKGIMVKHISTTSDNHILFSKDDLANGLYFLQLSSASFIERIMVLIQ